MHSHKFARRFWGRVEKTEGCWLYRGQVINSGYGISHMPGGRTTTAHRVSFILANGPIPDGLHICHRCDVRLCVRPDHLFSGTRSENMLDMFTKKRNRGKIGWDDAANIRRDLERGVNVGALAQRYGVSTASIYNIRRGATWSAAARSTD